MSRAFTKELDDAPIPGVPDRPVSKARNLVTETGASKIEGEIASLKDRLTRASFGENQSSLSRDLRYWEARKASMEIVPMPQVVDHVQFGTTATIERDGTRQELSIVGEDEADPTSGAIAWTAPLARAIDGAKVGDVIVFELPARQEEVSILEVRPYSVVS
ncbi:GreA/GreB family elongation factor [Aliirhizobium smilacinae]|uniref:Transcription elongation factor n=1 Tax=Aliirhizobium smilacinae TaxID=1395944 RepID=A0A5C4XC24_9HYPH|nr:GreA/GreB family elongation factor [Rhizobium smilacinae]TNM60270.1 transcription elongation factor [Rhizobium smilacinae]